MPYFPGIPPENLDDFRRWLADELNRINPNIIEGQEYMGFKIHYEEPDKYELGQIVYASGYYGLSGSPILGSPVGSPVIGWDPGAGSGMYEYSELGWQKLGAGTGGFVPTDHGTLQGLADDDHTQYHNDTRGDARYYTKAYINSLTLDLLANTTISAPADGEVLTYDNVTSKWVNEAVAADLVDLGDVNITSPAQGEQLTYNATSGKWENAEDTAIGIGQIDGGIALAVYLINQNIEGGQATETYKTSDVIDGGTA